MRSNSFPALMPIALAMIISCVPSEPEDANSNPEAAADAYSIRGDSTLTVDPANGVLSNDSDKDGGSLTAVLVDNASKATLTLNSDGSFTYAPGDPGHAYEIADTFSYKATDPEGAQSSAAPVVIIIVPVPEDMVCIHMPAGDVSTHTYRVISPNGGEVFHIGDTVRVHVHVNSNINTSMTLMFSLYSFTPPGIGGFDAFIDSIQTFVIPQYFEKQEWNEQTQQFDMVQISPVSDSCIIRVADYEDRVRDYSDCFFAIRK
jgi:hypothetical protein